MSATRSRWVSIAAGAALWALAVTACLVFGRPFRAGSSGVVGVLLVTALFSAFGLAPPVREFLRGLPRPHQVLAVSAVVVVVLGHVLGQQRATFPLVRWDMFTWVFEPESVVFHEMVGIRSDRTQIPLNYSHIVPSLHGTFYWSLESWGEHAGDEERYALIYSAILGSLGERYNQRHPEEPLRGVAVVRGTISRTPDGALDVRRESHWRVSLDRGRSR